MVVVILTTVATATAADVADVAWVLAGLVLVRLVEALGASVDIVTTGESTMVEYCHRKLRNYIKTTLPPSQYVSYSTLYVFMYELKKIRLIKLIPIKLCLYQNTTGV